MELAGRTLAKLMANFEYHVDELDSGDIVKVKKGFETDFASVPHIFWWLCPPLGRYGKATVVHDWGYKVQDRSRAEYDLIFLEGMNVLGVPLWKRSLMYSAVRMFGGGNGSAARSPSPEQQSSRWQVRFTPESGD